MTESEKQEAKCVLCDGRGVHQCPGGRVPAPYIPDGMTSHWLSPGLVDANYWGGLLQGKESDA